MTEKGQVLGCDLSLSQYPNCQMCYLLIVSSVIQECPESLGEEPPIQGSMRSPSSFCAMLNNSFHLLESPAGPSPLPSCWIWCSVELQLPCRADGAALPCLSCQELNSSPQTAVKAFPGCADHWIPYRSKQHSVSCTQQLMLPKPRPDFPLGESSCFRD